MGYSIELYFDLQFEEKIRLLWDELAVAGVPSILQIIDSRPHISIAVLENIDEVQVSILFENFIKEIPEFVIEFPAIALIPGKQQTVFLAPATNILIIEMQRSLYNLLLKNGYLPLERYRPNKWLPHCSISKELSSLDSLTTIEICQKSSVTGMAKVVEAGFIEFRPRKEIKRVGLKKR